MTDSELKQIFADNLNYYLNRSHKTQKEVADAIDVLPQTFNTWCQAIAIPRMGKVQLLADYFHINKSALIEEKIDALPVLGAVSCGEPVMMYEERSLPFSLRRSSSVDFLLKASGDSMKDAGILDGDMIFIHEQDTVLNGEIAAVAIGNEALLKRFYFFADQDRIVLHAENPDYADVVLEGEKMSDVRVLGVMVGLYRGVNAAR